LPKKNTFSLTTGSRQKGLTCRLDIVPAFCPITGLDGAQIIESAWNFG